MTYKGGSILEKESSMILGNNCVWRRKEEYGGYFPLEMRDAQEWFHEGEANIRRYNCGRTAIYAAAKAMAMMYQVKKIYVPYYICSTAVHAIEQAGIEVERFFLNEELEPKTPIPSDDDRAGMLAVNYFGLKDNFIRKASQKYCRMILDCTQAFFFPPIMKQGISNIYSCRKFIGVPDGAYLIGEDTCAEQFKAGHSWEGYTILCEAYELGMNQAYKKKLDNERRLGESLEGMSRLTRTFLQGVDYHFIEEKRKENFQKLQGLLSNINRFDFSNFDGIPQCYPLWLPRNIGQQMKEKLLEKRIYISTLWKECREICDKSSLEVELTNNLLCLPVDQRYSLEDMEFIAAIVTTCMEEIKS